jgi:hypothetical protein
MWRTLDSLVWSVAVRAHSLSSHGLGLEMAKPPSERARTQLERARMQQQADNQSVRQTLIVWC